jgi:hypothetical protein
LATTGVVRGQAERRECAVCRRSRMTDMYWKRRPHGLDQSFSFRCKRGTTECLGGRRSEMRTCWREGCSCVHGGKSSVRSEVEARRDPFPRERARRKSKQRERCWRRH